MNFQQSRSNMVAQQVQPCEVFNEKVLNVLSQLPREIFVPGAFVDVAYSDTDLPLGEGQTMLAPKVVGKILDALNLTGNEKVLEIGTGSGFLTACLSKLCEMVVSVEIYSSLLNQAEKNLQATQCKNVTLVKGDGGMGWKNLAPFDVIIVTGSYPLGIPTKICEQLLPGGRLFATRGLAPSMQAVIIERSETDYHAKVLFETVIPALINTAIPEKFEF